MPADILPCGDGINGLAPPKESFLVVGTDPCSPG